MLCNAAAGNLNISSIQNYLNILFLLIDFSPEDILEINDLFLQTHLRYFLSVPDEEFRSTHTYDYSKNIIISPQPYPSWVLVNGVWEAPFPAPVDYEGNSYVWDETITNWVQI